jgi:hypothetical protein
VSRTPLVFCIPRLYGQTTAEEQNGRKVCCGARRLRKAPMEVAGALIYAAAAARGVTWDDWVMSQRANCEHAREVAWHDRVFPQQQGPSRDKAHQVLVGLFSLLALTSEFKHLTNSDGLCRYFRLSPPAAALVRSCVSDVSDFWRPQLPLVLSLSQMMCENLSRMTPCSSYSLLKRIQTFNLTQTIISSLYSTPTPRRRRPAAPSPLCEPVPLAS